MLKDDVSNHSPRFLKYITKAPMEHVYLNNVTSMFTLDTEITVQGDLLNGFISNRKLKVVKYC